MKNKKVTIDELGITVRYQVRFSGKVSEKVAKQLRAMYDKDMEYSLDDDPLDGHPYEEAIELITDEGFSGAPSRYIFMIDSLEFSEEEPDEEE